MVIDLVIFVGAFAAIGFNIWHHNTQSDTDREVLLLIKNFAIAIGGVLLLFWRWGFFD